MVSEHQGPDGVNWLFASITRKSFTDFRVFQQKGKSGWEVEEPKFF